ncbi:hypothetical protein H4Q26_007450 [Puccinia striiformis f. sp. tritici PST-130]|nr:hypothetical protein H4Q26_007450 [Puccinia striiformis f. sp. tritici PST-130]
MRATTTAILLAISLSAVKATIHTTCYKLLDAARRGVFSLQLGPTKDAQLPQEHPGAVSAFTLQTSGRNFKRSDNELERRYDSRNPSFGGRRWTGICGFYDSVNTPGVCLWSGAEQNNPTVSTAGWLTDVELWQETTSKGPGNPTRQYVKVLDAENQAGKIIGGLTWEFDNVYGLSTQQGPV